MAKLNAILIISKPQVAWQNCDFHAELLILIANYESHRKNRSLVSKP